MDTLTPQRRSENMRRIRSKGMQPELEVRKLIHRLGYRFRLHDPQLPGKPDLVFSSRRKIILVHGCFWHQHKANKCKIARVPKSNLSYWAEKLSRNVKRDKVHKKALTARGWRVLTIWECEVNRPDLSLRVMRFLENGRVAAKSVSMSEIRNT